jgi:hypothetical protein
MIKYNCAICGKSSNSGIMINGVKICCSCEYRIVNVEIGTDFYIYIKNNIKKSMVQSLIRGADTKCQNYHL